MTAAEANSPAEMHSSSHAPTPEEEASCASLQQQLDPPSAGASDSPADALPAARPRPPAWVLGMLSSQFFGPCEAHKHLKKNECTHFCTTCVRGPGLCQHCLGGHHGHTVMQIRRYVYCDVVRNQDISPFIDTDGIQSYIINQSKVVFLNARPQSKLGSPSDPDTCAHCRRTLREGFSFCCLACKVEAEGNDLHTHSARSSAAAPLVSPAVPQQTLSRQPSSTSNKQRAAARHRAPSSPSKPRTRPAPARAQGTEQRQQLLQGQGQQDGSSPSLSGAGDEVSALGSGLKGSGSNQSSSWEEGAKAQPAEEREGRAAGGSGRCWEQERRGGTAMTAVEGCSAHGEAEAQAGCKRRRSSTTRSGRSVRPSSWVKGAAWGDDGASLASPAGPVPSPKLWVSREKAGLAAVAAAAEQLSGWEARDGGDDVSKLGGLGRPQALSNSNSSDLDESGSFFFQADGDGGLERGREGGLAGAGAGLLPLLAQVQQSLRRGAGGAGRRKQGAPQRSHHA